MSDRQLQKLSADRAVQMHAWQNIGGSLLFRALWRLDVFERNLPLTDRQDRACKLQCPLLVCRKAQSISKQSFDVLHHMT